MRSPQLNKEDRVDQQDQTIYTILCLECDKQLRTGPHKQHLTSGIGDPNSQIWNHYAQTSLEMNITDARLVGREACLVLEALHSTSSFNR